MIGSTYDTVSYVSVTHRSYVSDWHTLHCMLFFVFQRIFVVCEGFELWLPSGPQYHLLSNVLRQL